MLDGDIDHVRSSFGKNTLQIEFEGDGTFLGELPEVRKASIVNNSAELSLVDGSDPQRILQAAMSRLRVRRFEMATPSLEEIFIDKVGPASLAEVAN